MKKKRSDLKLFLCHEKMECKHGFRHFKYQTRFVYQDNLLSELRNSCSCHAERSNISTTTQKPQNSILSAVLKIHRRQECTNPGRLVAGVTMLHMAGEYYLQHKFCNIKLHIVVSVADSKRNVSWMLFPEGRSSELRLRRGVGQAAHTQ